jgi:PST family polysaccharide transporter
VGFRWSSANRRAGVLWLGVLSAVFVCPYLVPGWPAMIIGSVAAVLTGIYSLRRIFNLLPPDRLPQPVVKLARMLRLLPVGSASSA